MTKRRRICRYCRKRRYVHVCAFSRETTPHCEQCHERHRDWTRTDKTEAVAGALRDAVTQDLVRTLMASNPILARLRR